MDEQERDRLSKLLTPEEMSDPTIVEGARKGLAQSDLAAWEHEIAHRTVARILGARYAQTTVGEGVVEGTVFQLAVTSAAGIIATLPVSFHRRPITSPIAPSYAPMPSIRRAFARTKPGSSAQRRSSWLTPTACACSANSSKTALPSSSPVGRSGYSAATARMFHPSEQAAKFRAAREGLVTRIEELQAQLATARASWSSFYASLSDLSPAPWEVPPGTDPDPNEFRGWQRWIGDVVESVTITPAVRGRTKFDPSRVAIAWKARPGDSA